MICLTPYLVGGKIVAIFRVMHGANVENTNNLMIEVLNTFLFYILYALYIPNFNCSSIIKKDTLNETISYINHYRLDTVHISTKK